VSELDFGGAFWPLPLRLGPGWRPEQHARLCADLVAVKRTGPLCRLYVTQNTGSPFAASVAVYHGQNGNGLAYAPGLTVNGAGDVTLTWPAYWTDEFARQYPLKIRHAIPSASSTTARFVNHVISGRTVRVRSFDAAGAAIASNFGLRVW
jgi:hypothetical protein